MTLPAALPLSRDTLHALLGPRKGPCVSLAFPTHLPPHDGGDGTLVRHLLDRAAAALRANDERPRDGLLAPLRLLAEHRDLRPRDGSGVAAFAADGEAWVVPLEGPVAPAVHVGSHFHTLPILSRLSNRLGCRAVIVSSRLVRAVDAVVDRDGRASLTPAPIAAPSGSPRVDGRLERDEVVEPDREEPHRVMHGLGNSGDAVHGGFGSRSEGIDADTARFLHDAGTMLAAAAGATPPPLILVGLPRAVAALREPLPRGVQILAEVGIDPVRLEDAELAHIVADTLRMEGRRRVAAIADGLQVARAQGRGSADFAEIARAAVTGRVSMLVIEEGRGEPGTIDPRTGWIDFPDDDVVDVACGDDLYDTLAEIVLAHGGEVVTLPADSMPMRTGVAARYRWGNGGAERDHGPLAARPRRER